MPGYSIYINIKQNLLDYIAIRIESSHVELSHAEFKVIHLIS